MLSFRAIVSARIPAFISIQEPAHSKGTRSFLEQAPAVCLPLHPQPGAKNTSEAAGEIPAQQSPHMAAAVPGSTDPRYYAKHILNTHDYIQAARSSTVTGRLKHRENTIAQKCDRSRIKRRAEPRSSKDLIR